ncbi:MAG: HEPN domain-containing protein [Endomicrobium sp.]|nr:HEPN domain-containing protein [Endomicrobium sp.]
MSEFWPTRDIVFHCQQAIEKYFKAYLIENGWELQKTHDLDFLLAKIKEIKNLEINENFIKNIFSDYKKVRYPFRLQSPNKKERRRRRRRKG